MNLALQTTYTIDDIYALPEGQRAELIDGQLYMMAPPGTVHQRIVMNVAKKIANYIDSHNGSCEVFPSPFAVFLEENGKTYLEPDISVICDSSKLDDRGCHGAPDWVIEITSPSNPQRDYGIKLFRYRSAGVREYWIINPQKKNVLVFDFDKDEKSNLYTFREDIPSCIFDDFSINISESLQCMKPSDP